jgi:cytochrome c-type biogenesis protein
MYYLGLATTLTIFGLSAALLGTLFGSSGGFSDAAGLVSSAVLIAMGLYLLEIIQFEFPSFETDVNKIAGVEIPANLQSFLFGATTALIASPCSSPVLTSLLAIVAASGSILLRTVFDYHRYSSLQPSVAYNT